MNRPGLGTQPTAGSSLRLSRIPAEKVAIESALVRSPPRRGATDQPRPFEMRCSCANVPVALGRSQCHDSTRGHVAAWEIAESMTWNSISPEWSGRARDRLEPLSVRQNSKSVGRSGYGGQKRCVGAIAIVRLSWASELTQSDVAAAQLPTFAAHLPPPPAKPPGKASMSSSMERSLLQTALMLALVLVITFESVGPLARPD